MSDVLTTNTNLSKKQLAALRDAFLVGIAQRPGKFYHYRNPTGRGVLLEALEIVEEDLMVLEGSQ